MVIKRDVTIGGCRLILGDMRQVLPLIEDRADMIMSDVPYRLTSGGKNSMSGGCLSPENYDNSGELFPIVEWADMAPLIADACAEQADVIIMVSDREEAAGRLAFEAAGLRFHRLLVWDKITATANRWYMPNCEFGLYLFKGGARRIRDCSSKALIRCPQRDVSKHPTEKPVALMEYWIRNSTDPGDLVIDPFMGSGSTICAAMKSGRRAIGIEQDPEWFEVACRRLRAMAETPCPAQAVAGPAWKQEGFAL